MRITLATFATIAGLLSANSGIAASTPAGLVQRGLDAYAKGDAAAAIRGWLQGSALEGNTQAMTQSNSLRQIEDFYGKYQSFQILGEHDISESSRQIYFVMNYTKGPIFVRMQVYRLEDGTWVSTEFKLHTEAGQVLPHHLAFGPR